MSDPAPKSLFSFRNLTPQLFVLVILPLTVLLVVIAFGGLNLHKQAMRTLVGERDQRAVTAAARTLEEQLNHRATAVRTLSLRIQEEDSPDALAAILEAPDFAPEVFDYGLAFLARGGEVLASSGSSGFWTNFDPEADPDLGVLLSRDAPPVFIQTSHPVDRQPVVLVIAPRVEGGPVAAGAFSPAGLAESILEGVFTPGDRAVAFMVDSQTRLLFEAGGFGGGETPESHAGVREALAGQTGATYIEVDGNEHVVAYSPVPPVRWALIIEEPWDTVASPLLRTTENAPLILVPAFVLAVFALWFGFHQVVQPLRALEKQAAAIGWGDYEAVDKPVGGVAEIQRLHTELVHLTHKVRSAQQGLRGYIGAMTTGQEEERRRLARELHDDTLQDLIALNQRVQLVRLGLDNEQSAAQVAEIQDLIGQTIANLRRISRALRPIYLEELGLVAALEALVRETRQSSDLDIRFRSAGEQRRLSSSEELSLYRMAQEGLNNILRHAGAATARIELAYEPANVRLAIWDSGRGFNIPESPAGLAPQGHFGLLGLHERAELIGARLAIDSAPGKGTRVTIDLPSRRLKDGEGEQASR